MPTQNNSAIRNPQSGIHQLPLTIHIQGPMTYEEIARSLGLCSRTVRDSEKRAFRKLRKAIEADPNLKESLMIYLENDTRLRNNFYEFLKEVAR